VYRRALPAPERGGAAERPWVAPRTAAEEVLAEIWGEVLGLERVGVEDNFFELGGHSLVATRMVSRVRQAFAVEVPLRAVFEAQTIRALAGRVEALRGTTAEVTPVVPVPRDGDLPLSFAQQRLWFLDRLEPGSAVYNIPVALRLGGELDARGLAWALTEVVRRHEVLRTTFGAGADGEPVQVVHPPAPVRLPVVDLSGLDAAERKRWVERLSNEEAARPFDLARGPVMRCALLRLGAEASVVLFTLHHIASDGWSMEILQREVTALYGARVRGEDPPLPDLPVQYADYAVWQRRWLEGEVLERQVAYWRERLAGAPAVLELPLDHPRPAASSGRGADRGFSLSPELSRSLRELGRREGATPYMTLLAAWNALLARYGAGDDVVVGTPVAGRTRLEAEGLIGFFVNTLVIRTGLQGDPTFRELLARVREGVLEAQAHQDVPFERLVDELAVERSLSHTPLFQVVFSLGQAARREDGLRLGGVEIDALASGGETAKFDLGLGMRDLGEWLEGSIAYRTELFDAATAERLAGHFVRLLEQAAADPGARLSELELLDAAARRRVLEEWNDTASVVSDGPVHRRFEAWAARTPHAPAVVSADGTAWSYAELNTRANRIARHLRALGVGPETRVAVLMGRSAEMVAAIYAVMKAGGAYVPVDPGYPAGRVAHLLADSAASIVLTTSELVGRAASTDAGVIALDAEEFAGEDDTDLPVEIDPGSLAYAIYTSGSTGTPKGVGIPHRALANHMAWMHDTFPLRADDRVLQKTPFSFDASVWEFHAPLIAGAALVMAPPDAERDPALLLREVEAQGITILQVVPTLLGALLDEPALARCGSLRRLFAGGEALAPGRVRRLRDRLPSVDVVNLYGPTEVCIDATAHVAGGDSGTTVPIGRPVANTRAYVLDARMRPAAPGVPGELYLGGAQVGRGYLGLPARTAASFVPDPFAGEPGARLYRTGDRARWRVDGVLEYLGRADQQVKVRGVRIEPGEIESVLREHAGVREAVVVAREDAPGEKRLVAYVVGDDAPPPAAELRAHLAARLPEHMVPGAIVALDALPLTPSGKVDRRALPAPERGGAAERPWVAPRTAAEEVLAEIWGEVLGLERVGVEDNFFELGGHSLVATRMVSRVRQAFAVEVPLRAVFEAQTIRALAGRVEALRGTTAQVPPVLPVARDGELPLSFAQQRLWFLDRLEPGSAVYNIPVALRLG
ncbi:MAG TPA: amino acid adenylation domain-containing protein, partial [Longimicrobium sp.]|nr:amino acid adenylation domain-containing protein [Longimicrobium sp.]